MTTEDPIAEARRLLAALGKYTDGGYYDAIDNLHAAAPRLLAALCARLEAAETWTPPGVPFCVSCRKYKAACDGC